MAHQVRDSYLLFISAKVDVVLHSNTDTATDKVTGKDPLLDMVAPVVMVADSLSNHPLVPLPAPTLSTFHPCRRSWVQDNNPLTNDWISRIVGYGNGSASSTPTDPVTLVSLNFVSHLSPMTNAQVTWVV